MKKIIIVDDNKPIRETIKDLLVGYEVIEFGSGEGFLEYGGGIDLLILDLMLPGVDGGRVLERIRGQGFPVIVLTAKNVVEVGVLKEEEMVKEVIDKPFNAELFLRRVGELLDGYGRKELSGV